MTHLNCFHCHCWRSGILGGKKRREWVKKQKQKKKSAHKVYREMTQQQKRVKETRSLVQNNIKEVVLSASNRKLSVSCYNILNDLQSPGQFFLFLLVLPRAQMPYQKNL